MRHDHHQIKRLSPAFITSLIWDDAMRCDGDDVESFMKFLKLNRTYKSRINGYHYKFSFRFRKLASDRYSLFLPCPFYLENGVSPPSLFSKPEIMIRSLDILFFSDFCHENTCGETDLPASTLSCPHFLLEVMWHPESINLRGRVGWQWGPCVPFVMEESPSEKKGRDGGLGLG